MSQISYVFSYRYNDRKQGQGGCFGKTIAQYKYIEYCTGSAFLEKRRLMKRLMFVTALAAILSCAGIASADQLAVNGVGLDPTQVGTSGFTLSETSNGATTMKDIVFLFSLPTGSGAPSGLSSSVGTFGSVSLAGSLASTGCHDAHSWVCISGGTNSDNFANFSGFESSINGITATSLDIYELTLSGVNLAP